MAQCVLIMCRAVGRAVDDGASWPRLPDVRFVVGRLHLRVHLLRSVGRAHGVYSDRNGGPVRLPTRAASPLVRSHSKTYSWPLFIV